MNLKYLSPIFAVSAIAVTATSAWSESTVTQEQNVFCESHKGTPTTVAMVQGETKPIFHWRSDALPQSANPQELCQNVSAKLATYPTQENQLSFGSHDQGGLPAICAEATPGKCDLVLFTLAPAENPIEEGNRVLENILDSSLQRDKQISTARGVQSISYPVTFWQLLGFR
ncbi:hypothetical protein IQ238_11600 [Pleurocapsales cyanobacterium LEGE 06147]|nr:hypothetical protein [Pleurocapsales cyanobacterium LEGE 06147]